MLTIIVHKEDGQPEPLVYLANDLHYVNVLAEDVPKLLAALREAYPENVPPVSTYDALEKRLAEAERRIADVERHTPAQDTNAKLYKES